MTCLLQEALRQLESLSQEEQDAIASQIMDTLDDEEAWARSFNEKPKFCDRWGVRLWRSTGGVRRVRWTNCSDEVVHIATLSRDVRRSSDRVQLQARRAYQLFKQNPSHPGLNFRKVDHRSNIYSARIGLGCRVLGQMEGWEIVWFRIGPHREYDRLV